jgi:hypothetical protein
MGSRDEWNALGTGLPQPLAISRQRRPNSVKWTRHLQVRAVHYHRETKKSPPEMFLTKEFSNFFAVNAKTPRKPSHDDLG